MHRRPWGWYRVLAKGEGYLVKELFVEEGKRTSLQRHRHRDEYWVVLEGDGKAVIGEKEVDLLPGTVVKVGRGVVHRLIGPVRLIEVWVGDLLEEEDIERLEDDYGRA